MSKGSDPVRVLLVLAVVAVGSFQMLLAARASTRESASANPSGPAQVTAEDLNSRVVFHGVIQNPRCFGSTTTITPPDVLPLFAAREEVVFLPVLYGYDPAVGTWDVAFVGHFNYIVVDGSIDRTGLPIFNSGPLSAYWVELPDNGPPAEEVEMTARWYYQWVAFVWWRGSDYLYQTAVSPVHNELVLGKWTWAQGCDRRQ